MERKTSTVTYGEYAAAAFINEAITRQAKTETGADAVRRALKILTEGYHHKDSREINGLQVFEEKLAKALDSHPDARIQRSTFVENTQAFYEAVMSRVSEKPANTLSDAAYSLLPIAKAFVNTYETVVPGDPSQEDGNARLYTAIVNLLPHTDV